MVREGWKMCENVQRAWSEWDWVDEKGVGGKERVRFFYLVRISHHDSGLILAEREILMTQMCGLVRAP